MACRLAARFTMIVCAAAFPVGVVVGGVAGGGTGTTDGGGSLASVPGLAPPPFSTAGCVVDVVEDGVVVDDVVVDGVVDVVVEGVVVLVVLVVVLGVASAA
jgi:hypothetical protein